MDPFASATVLPLDDHLVVDALKPATAWLRARLAAERPNRAALEGRVTALSRPIIVLY